MSKVVTVVYVDESISYDFAIHNAYEESQLKNMGFKVADEIEAALNSDSENEIKFEHLDRDANGNVIEYKILFNRELTDDEIKKLDHIQITENFEILCYECDTDEEFDTVMTISEIYSK